MIIEQDIILLIGLLVAMFVLIPLLMKAWDFIGIKSGILKRYLPLKGQRFGMGNRKKTLIGEISVPCWEALKGMLGLVIILVISLIIPNIKVLNSIITLIVTVWGVYCFYIISQFFHCTCLYCSTSRADVERYIEKGSQKNQFFKSQITNIQYEDGWYMVYRKESEEIWEEMLRHPNTYIRDCPKKLKKLCSLKHIILLSLPFFITSSGLYYLCLKLFEPSSDILEIISIIPALIFAFLLQDRKNDLLRKCESRFREEQNFPKEKYEVNVRYDKAEGGRLIITVIEKTENEETQTAKIKETGK